MDKEISILSEASRPNQGPRHVIGPWLIVLCGLLLTGLVTASSLQRYRALQARKAERQRALENHRIVTATAIRLDLPPALLLAIAQTESAFDDRCISHKGATGLLQVMPATARETAAALRLDTYDLLDPRDNALIGAAYLKSMLRRYRNDLHLALAAYNAGPANVDRWQRQAMGLPGPETVEQFAFDETRA